MKKNLSVFLALALLIACIPLCASATGTATISAGFASALAGETVQIPIRIENNPGIMGCTISFSYDPAVLTLESADNANLFSAGSYTFSGSLTVNPFNLIWYDYTGNHSDSGDFALLTFRINADADPGDTTVTVTYNADGTFDTDYNPIAFATQNGTVTVLAPEVGGWSFSEDCTLYTYESPDSGLHFVCGLNSLDDAFISDYVETTGGWTFEVVPNDKDQESTGAQLVIYDENGTAVEEYYAVLFGDINGDGSFNGLDILIYLDMNSGKWGDFFLSDEYPETFAADLNHDGDVNGLDVLCILDCMSKDDTPFQFIDA